MVKLRKLKFGINVQINESVKHANFVDPRSRDRELKYNKNFKKSKFWLENLLICQ